MNYTLVLNAASPSLPARAKELRRFALDNLGDLKAGATIVVHDGRAERQWLLDNTFTERVVLLKIGGPLETVLKVLPDYCRDADLIVFPGDYFGDEAAVRLACRLGGGSLVSADGLKVEDGRIFCEKKVYSQQLQAVFEMTKSPVCLSIARGGEEGEFAPRGRLEVLEADHSQPQPDFIISSNLTKTEKAAGPALARRLIVAGQGLGSREALERLGELAEAVGAELGVTRPVTMKAWAPLTKLVGISGAMTRPELCLTFGASGAAAFYAGIEKSGFIISVNRDPQAPIVRKSDVAVIDDALAVLEELQKLIAAQQ